MFVKSLIINIFFSLVVILNIYAFSEQKIEDFYLSNFKEDGSRAWEVKGDEAIMYEKHIDIEVMRAKYYTESGIIKITSNKAKMIKGNMDLHLKENVVITNEEGFKIETDYLNWKKEENKIMTNEFVKASNETMEITAQGLQADTVLKNADFQKDVKVRMADQGSGVTTITCSGSLEINYDKGTAVFNGNVVAIGKDGNLFADKMTMYMDVETKEMQKMVSEGNVKIVKDGNVIFSEKATYIGSEQRIVLEGRPRLLFYPEKEEAMGLD